MEQGVQWAEMIWRSQIGTVLLYGAFAIHLSLAFWALYIRRHLRMGWIEAVRLTLGLLIPVLIVQHPVGIRLAWTLYDTHRIYRSTLFNQWVGASQIAGIRQVTVLGICLAAWLHRVAPVAAG
jgi:adenylate cyclase